ncbi:MAG: hypothetical protein Q7V19_09570, partial [Bacteroidales bacterium]|nr:hypothetical protein [Bacteroidales bacterium]
MKNPVVGIILLTMLFGMISCKKEEGLSSEELLEWNKKIAEAYVHSYAVSIGEAVEDMADEATIINYIRRATDPISFYPDSSGYFYVYDF